MDGKKGDIWMVQGFQQRFVRWKARETDGPQARLAVENGWFDGDRKFVKRGRRDPHACRRRTAGGSWSSRCASRPPTGRSRSPGTPEGKKGFGGFCFRFAPRDGGAAKTVIRTDQGIAEERRRAFAPPLGGDHAAPSRATPPGPGLTTTPSNPGYPNNGWLHAARVRLPERLLSGPRADHARARQAAGAEVPRDPVCGRGGHAEKRQMMNDD